MLLVTSLGKTGYDQYGERMLESLKKHSKLPGRVYSEDEITFPHKKLHDVQGWESFYNDTAHLEPKNYLFDARRFCHKVYAQLDAFDSGERYIVWIDGDCVFTKDITKTFLKKLTKESFCAYLGRKGTYTETGFLIFDTEHDDFPRFKSRYRELYDKRLIFRLPYWIDCLAFDVSRDGLQARNLTPDVEGMVDVFSRSPLAPYIEHDKGARKFRRENEPLSNTA